jgi:hypothetical protein
MVVLKILFLSKKRLAKKHRAEDNADSHMYKNNRWISIKPELFIGIMNTPLHSADGFGITPTKEQYCIPYLPTPQANRQKWLR